MPQEKAPQLFPTNWQHRRSANTRALSNVTDVLVRIGCRWVSKTLWGRLLAPRMLPALPRTPAAEEIERTSRVKQHGSQLIVQLKYTADVP